MTEANLLKRIEDAIEAELFGGEPAVPTIEAAVREALLSEPAVEAAVRRNYENADLEEGDSWAAYSERRPKIAGWMRESWRATAVAALDAVFEEVETHG